MQDRIPGRKKPTDTTTESELGDTAADIQRRVAREESEREQLRGYRGRERREGRMDWAQMEDTGE